MAQALTEYWQRSQPKEMPMEKRHTFTRNGITYISTDEINSYTCEGCAFSQYDADCEATISQHNCFSDENKPGFIWVKQDAVIQQKEQADIDSARRDVFYPLDARIIHGDY